MMDRERVRYWLALAGFRDIEAAVLREAVRRFGGAREIFEADRFQLSGFSTALSQLTREPSLWSRVEREMGLVEKAGAELLTMDDPRYPGILHSSYDPPLLLYVKGDLGALDLQSMITVAIVGTRRPTRYGERLSTSIAAGLSEAGLIIVSGMARGCDSAAHRGALGAGGKTIAVLGTGVDKIYPGENRKLYEEILSSGLLVSEYPIGTPPLPQNFPRRNRIISGLSMGVLVAEAPLRSGAMMTARLALEDGKEIFALPGRVDSKESAGTNKLIKDGALLVTGPDDILETLTFMGVAVKGKNKKRAANRGDADDSNIFVKLSSEFGESACEAEKILRLLDDGPIHTDGILNEVSLPLGSLSTLLLDMELKGYVVKGPGNLFEKN